MATVVKVQGHAARWTPQGWKTGDAQLDALCDSAEQTAPFVFDPSPQQAAAERLAAALQGEIVSVDPLDDEEAPAGAIY